MATPSEGEKAWEQAVNRYKDTYVVVLAANAVKYDNTVDAATKAAASTAFKAALAASEAAKAQIALIDRIVAFESSAKAFAATESILNSSRISRMEKMKAAYFAINKAELHTISLNFFFEVTRDPVVNAAMVKAGLFPRAIVDVVPTKDATKVGVPFTVSAVTVI